MKTFEEMRENIREKSKTPVLSISEIEVVLNECDGCGGVHSFADVYKTLKEEQKEKSELEQKFDDVCNQLAITEFDYERCTKELKETKERLRDAETAMWIKDMKIDDIRCLKEHFENEVSRLTKIAIDLEVENKKLKDKAEELEFENNDLTNTVADLCDEVNYYAMTDEEYFLCYGKHKGC